MCDYIVVIAPQTMLFLLFLVPPPQSVVNILCIFFTHLRYLFVSTHVPFRYRRQVEETREQKKRQARASVTGIKSGVPEADWEDDPKCVRVGLAFLCMPYVGWVHVWYAQIWL